MRLMTCILFRNTSLFTHDTQSFLKTASLKSCTIMHPIILIARLLLNTEHLLNIYEIHALVYSKASFLNHESYIPLHLSLSLCLFPIYKLFFFISRPCFLNGLSSQGVNKCIVDSCDVLNISVWVVRARAHVDL